MHYNNILFSAYNTPASRWYVLGTLKINSTFYWQSDNTTRVHAWADNVHNFGKHIVLMRDGNKYHLVNTGRGNLLGVQASAICEWPK